jgi:hypothetical protein
LTAVDVELRNLRAFPTRSARSAEKAIGRPDAFSIEGDGLEVLAGGFRTDRFRPERIELAEREPARLLREAGIGGRDSVRVRWILRGTGEARIRVTSEKARDVELSVSIP